MTQTKEQRENYIAALIREREGYARSGDTDAVKGVDAELARLGASAEPPAKRSSKRVTKAEEVRA